MNNYLNDENFQIFRHISKDNLARLIEEKWERDNILTSIYNLKSTSQDQIMRFLLTKLIEYCKDSHFNLERSSIAISILIDTLQNDIQIRQYLNETIDYLLEKFKLHSKTSATYSIRVDLFKFISILAKQKIDESKIIKYAPSSNIENSKTQQNYREMLQYLNEAINSQLERSNQLKTKKSFSVEDDFKDNFVIKFVTGKEFTWQADIEKQSVLKGSLILINSEHECFLEHLIFDGDGQMFKESSVYYLTTIVAFKIFEIYKSNKAKVEMQELENLIIQMNGQIKKYMKFAV